MADRTDPGTDPRLVLVIGIGAGDPRHITVEAIEAMNRVDVFLAVDKGEATSDLAGLRAELLARHVTRPYRVATTPELPRDRRPADYPGTVADWQGRREAAYEELLDALAPGEVGGFLVWGDPALYDGTLRILQRIGERAVAAGGRPVEVVSVPGISAVQVLAARHRLILNRIGEPVLITTGRRLAERGMPADVPDVLVMLDGGDAFLGLPDSVTAGLDIYWGAYLGLPDEVLMSGELRTVGPQIARVRAACRARKGWIMDTYLLRRR
ncbi:precorrin-6A synthase (deacetylating) [Pseudonocardia sp.]|uniref:precorrin-6A synthase (deacetylating) n=1 Tax=Pseudonocardia sp. TaxID=60912 RepID=UPI003D13ED07